MERLGGCCNLSPARSENVRCGLYKIWNGNLLSGCVSTMKSKKLLAILATCYALSAVVYEKPSS